MGRAAGGPRGAKFFIFIRGAVATIFFSTNLYYGGMLMAVLLRCIFGSAARQCWYHQRESAGLLHLLVLPNGSDVCAPYRAEAYLRRQGILQHSRSVRRSGLGYPPESRLAG